MGGSARLDCMGREVEVSDELRDFCDRYKVKHGLASREDVVARALELLRAQDANGETGSSPAG